MFGGGYHTSTSSSATYAGQVELTPLRGGSEGLYSDHSPQPLAPSHVHTWAEGGGLVHDNTRGATVERHHASPLPRAPTNSYATTSSLAPPVQLRDGAPPEEGGVGYNHRSSSGGGTTSTAGASVRSVPPTPPPVNTTKQYWELRRAEALLQETSRRNDALTRQQQALEDVKRRARARLHTMHELTEARRKEAVVATEEFRNKEDTLTILSRVAGGGVAPSLSQVGGALVPSYWMSPDALFAFVQTHPHYLLPAVAPFGSRPTLMPPALSRSPRFESEPSRHDSDDSPQPARPTVKSDYSLDDRYTALLHGQAPQGPTQKPSRGGLGPSRRHY